MPLSPGTYDRVVAHLSQARPIRARKMFGGAGIYFGEVFFCIVDDDRVFFKVDETNLADYDAHNMGPWMMDGTAQTNYREVPQTVYEDLGLLGEWIEKSTVAARNLKSKKK